MIPIRSFWKHFRWVEKFCNVFFGRAGLTKLTDQHAITQAQPAEKTEIQWEPFQVTNHCQIFENLLVLPLKKLLQIIFRISL